MIYLKSPREIEELHRVNRIVGEILQILRGHIRPGISTADLEDVVAEEVKRRGVRPAFQGVPHPSGAGTPYPAAICASVNDEIVHGIPSRKKILRDGDLLSIDFGVYDNQFYGDAAFSQAVGKASDRVRHLIDTVDRALEAGLAQARPGARLGDLGAAVQEVVEGAGLTVVREFVGHGIGRSLHEDPQVPNFGTRGKGLLLRPGMVLAIEPMINDGALGIRIDPDGWTARTKDGSFAAHAEHSVAVTEDGPLVLSRPG